MQILKTVLLPSAYLPPIFYFKKLTAYDHLFLELHEHFQKQTIRNRTFIYGPNGKQLLVIPLKSRKERTIMKDIRISYTDPWQKLHWRSLESAYRRSAYFEFYEDELKPFYMEQKFTFLVDFNAALTDLLTTVLKLNKTLIPTSDYQKLLPECEDLRNAFSPRHSIPKQRSYPQVFENKFGFIPDLSIADLLFSQGPEATDFLSA